MSTTTVTFKGASSLKEARFDAASSVVEVEFANGKTSRLGNFTQALLDEWAAAPSAGKWFSENVTKRPDLYPPAKPAPDSPADAKPAATELHVPDGSLTKAPAAAPPKPETFRPPLPGVPPAPSNGAPTPAEQDRALAAALSELDLVKTEMKRLTEGTVSASDSMVNAAVNARTKDLTNEIETLRKRVAELEAKERAGFRPWHKP